MLLTFVPFYNVHAIKFNANTVLTPFWALTTWWFLRSFETRRVGWAVLAGIAAAAMLAKYWSITLLAGLGVAALSDPRRTAYFSSPAPYVTLAVGTILLTPNIYWLMSHAFMLASYARWKRILGTSALALFSALVFTSNGLAYAVAAIVLCVPATRPSWAAIRDTLWPSGPERRTLVIAFVAPFLCAVLIAVLLTVAIESIWVTPAMTLLPIERCRRRWSRYPALPPPARWRLRGGFSP